MIVGLGLTRCVHMLSSFLLKDHIAAHSNLHDLSFPPFFFHSSPPPHLPPPPFFQRPDEKNKRRVKTGAMIVLVLSPCLFHPAFQLYTRFIQTFMCSRAGWEINFLNSRDRIPVYVTAIAYVRRLIDDASTSFFVNSRTLMGSRGFRNEIRSTPPVPSRFGSKLPHFC